MKALKRLILGAGVLAVLAMVATPAHAGTVKVAGQVKDVAQEPNGSVTAKLKTKKVKRNGRSFKVPTKLVAYEVKDILLRCAGDLSGQDFKSPALGSKDKVNVTNGGVGILEVQDSFLASDPAYPGVFQVSYENSAFNDRLLGSNVSVRYFADGDSSASSDCAGGGSFLATKVGGKNGGKGGKGGKGDGKKGGKDDPRHGGKDGPRGGKR